jgi:hypothetical protein
LQLLKVLVPMPLRPVWQLKQPLGWMQAELLPDDRFQWALSPVLMPFLTENYCPPDPKWQDSIRPGANVRTLH